MTMISFIIFYFSGKIYFVFIFGGWFLSFLFSFPLKDITYAVLQTSKISFQCVVAGMIPYLAFYLKNSQPMVPSYTLTQLLQIRIHFRTTMVKTRELQGSYAKITHFSVILPVSLFWAQHPAQDQVAWVVMAPLLTHPGTGLHFLDLALPRALADGCSAGHQPGVFS